MVTAAQILVCNTQDWSLVTLLGEHYRHEKQILPLKISPWTPVFDRGLYFFLIMTFTLSDLGFNLVSSNFCGWTCKQKQCLCCLVQKLCISSEKHWPIQDLFIICNHLRLFHHCEENSLLQIFNCALNMHRRRKNFTLSMNWVDAGVRGWEWSDKAAGFVLFSTAAHHWKDTEPFNYLNRPF